jgi:hypothetical protein
MQRRDLLKTLTLGMAASLAVSSVRLLPSALAQAKPITAESWTEAAGFKPDLTKLPVQPGGTVHKGNVDKVAAMLPPGLSRLVKKYELKINVTPYTPIHPSLSYIQATQANLGKTKIWDVGKDFRKLGMSGYVAGLPFPKPNSGLEVAWNFLNAYNGDDGDRHYDVYWVSGKSGVEHNEYWRWSSVRTAFRTDIDPKPHIKEQYDRRIVSMSITYAIEPYDKKGFGALYARSIDPVDLQGHVYVPAMRRVLRNTFGTRGDTWNATNYLYEDVNGYLGAVEWMNWKLVGTKTMLMPMNVGAKRGKDGKVNFEFDKWPHWNPKANWQPRPVYVLEVTPKIPDYPYSRMLIVVDAETYIIPYKEAYDKKGELWKIILNGMNASPDMNTQPQEPGLSVAIDLQAEHATAISFRKFEANTNVDMNLFTLANLRKRGN